jgi:hypothetical protein
VVVRAVVGPAGGGVVPGGVLVRAVAARLRPGRVGEGLELLAGLEAPEMHQGLVEELSKSDVWTARDGKGKAASGIVTTSE